MIKVWKNKNVYQPENFTEKINKKCCQSVAPYVVKCETCQEIFCFHHVRTVGKEQSKRLVCYRCVWKEEE